MRLCRFEADGRVQAGFYHEQFVVPLTAAAEAYSRETSSDLSLPGGDDLLDYLPPDGVHAAAARRVADWLGGDGRAVVSSIGLATDKVRLQVPVPRPNKLLLLAGNYAAHIEEGGGIAAERAETFPYLFMKPPSTTLTHPGSDVPIPAVSPNTIDYELELAIVIGRRCKGVSEAEALDYVAGFTIINDVSDRKFRPNPQRKKRDRDAFFDWQHGKWHDHSCPCGPCIVSRDAVEDPQQLSMQLRVNGELRQDASTSLQIFPAAAVVAFVASFVTLEPGDLISTGTPAGVGSTTNTYLQPGDEVEGSIEQIGTLRFRMS